MFDIGLFELVLVAVISLLVLGPERLPEAVRTAALHIGRLKRMYRAVRSDIEREIGADEIRRQLHNEEIMQSLNASKEEMAALAEDTHQSLNQVLDPNIAPANAKDSSIDNSK